MRGQGRIFQPVVNGKRCHRWWVDYSLDGKRFREATGTTDRRLALRVLRSRTEKRESGELVGRPERVTFADLRQLIEAAYKEAGNRSSVRLKAALNHLETFFGVGAKVPSITAARVSAYAAHRLEAGAGRATVGYEKAILRRALRLGAEKGLLTVVPKITTPKVENTRKGFFTQGELGAVLVELPADVRALVTFLVETGWRRDEGRLLTWAEVEWDGYTITLPGSRSKSGEPRVFPFEHAPTLRAVLEAQWASRECLFVFSRTGTALGVGAVRSAWHRAVTRAGIPKRLLHDLRRTCARNMRRQGLAESDIMALCGWETREMFKRYCIKDEAALSNAVARANGKVTAKYDTPTPAPTHVS